MPVQIKSFVKSICIFSAPLSAHASQKRHTHSSSSGLARCRRTPELLSRWLWISASAMIQFQKYRDCRTRLIWLAKFWNIRFSFYTFVKLSDCPFCVVHLWDCFLGFICGIDFWDSFVLFIRVINSCDCFLWVISEVHFGDSFRWFVCEIYLGINSSHLDISSSQNERIQVFPACHLLFCQSLQLILHPGDGWCERYDGYEIQWSMNIFKLKFSTYHSIFDRQI